MSKRANDRDEFPPAVRATLGRRASWICSNPGCRGLTCFPAESDDEKAVYRGKAAHITAAAPKGPRYDASMSEDERKSISNAIYMCTQCAELIDQNNGIDYAVDTLKGWKAAHEEWVSQHLNQSPWAKSVIVDGLHLAEGQSNVTALDIVGPATIKPGARSVARGDVNVTATKIRPVEDKE